MELQYIKGIGPKRIKLLHQLGIYTSDDLIMHFPYRYIDHSILTPIADLIPGEVYTILGQIIRIEEQVPKKGLTILKALIKDNSGIIVATWFNQSYLKQKLKPTTSLRLRGKVLNRLINQELIVQDFEILDSMNIDNVQKIIPIYPLVKGLNQLIIRKSIQEVLKNRTKFEEFFTEKFSQNFGLINKQKAIENIHAPNNFNDIEQARKRLVFEELFLLQLTLLLLKIKYHQEKMGVQHLNNQKFTEPWLNKLPFSLTCAQNRVINEVKEDMANHHCMRRLIQGDVGSGKTVIAAWAILNAVQNGYQGVFMAPTEILAQQHYANLLEWFTPLGIKIGLLTGSLLQSKKNVILNDIKSGVIQVIVGTHALFQQAVNFNKLSLLVIDEQHRFGVKQRTMLEDKGSTPDMLVMSATPIPRTLALTLYGDLDISILDELPPGRKNIETICILEKARAKLNNLLYREIIKGRQAYIVCPLIEESAALDLQNALNLFEEINKNFKNFQVGLLHGRMKTTEKEEIMAEFIQGNLQILISTTVIEVGVNVPNATVMIIENAERFGLAQLHQLRGRVGRGGDQAFCILVTNTKSPQALQRLKLMTQTNDGFQLAEEDMLLRGPGDFFGTKQHGLPELRIAKLPEDQQVLEEAKKAALALIKEDPHLIRPAHHQLKNIIMKKMANMVKS